MTQGGVGFPFEIGCADPRSQKRDLGHPSICYREGGSGSFLSQLAPRDGCCSGDRIHFGREFSQASAGHLPGRDGRAWRSIPRDMFLSCRAAIRPVLRMGRPPRSCSNLARTASSSARSATICTRGRSAMRSRSIRKTISGLRIRVRTWSSSSTRKAAWHGVRPQAGSIG
jgi:hypothetical protein